MLKGPSSLKSYSGLPFNVLKASGRALIAYSPNQSPGIFYNYWSYPLYSFYDLQCDNSPIEGLKATLTHFSASYPIPLESSIFAV